MTHTMDLKRKLSQKYVSDEIRSTDFFNGSRTPLVVEFDTTEACMMACPGCISEELVNHHNSFSNSRIMELAEEMVASGVKAVILIGGGEPLAHPKVGEFIEYLGEHDIHIGITTNGVLIDRYLDTIAKYSKWTRVSMDAASAETFDKLRPGKGDVSYFDRVINNIRELGKIKTGKLGYSFLIRTEADGCGIESNIGEIFAAAELAKELGCDYFEVKPSYNYAGGQAHSLVVHDPQKMLEAKQQIEKALTLETDDFRIMQAITLQESLNGVQSRQKKAYHYCPVAELRTLVTPSGVYMCPYWRGKDRFRLGDVQHQSFSEMWKGEQHERVRRFTDPSRVCQFHCLRHDSNLEIFRQMSLEKVETTEEFDRFI